MLENSTRAFKVSYNNLSYNYFSKDNCASPSIKNSISNILSTLSSTKIRFLQLDPFGFCNAKCWFCPVKYIGNPESGKTTMSPDLLSRILEDVVKERNDNKGIVSMSFKFVYTSHYNEVLLYKHFGYLCKELLRHKLLHMILSNGVTLSKDRVEEICEYRDSVAGIALNIPAFDAATWAERTGFKEAMFDKLVENVQYATKRLASLDKPLSLSIQVNGINEQSLHTTIPGEKSFLYIKDVQTDLQNQVEKAKALFPTASIRAHPYLVDRVGFLPKDILSNEEHMKSRQAKIRKVIGCSNTVGGASQKGRPFEWLTVNAAGKAFMCCDDYNFDYVIGDMNTQSLRDFWGKPEHAFVIKRAFSNMCKKCTSAVFAEK